MKKKFLLIISFVVVGLLLFFGWECQPISEIAVSYDIWDDHCDTFQVFYTTGHEWNEYASVAVDYCDAGETARLTFKVPCEDLTALRFDLGKIPGAVSISNVRLSVPGKTVEVNCEQMVSGACDSIMEMDVTEREISVREMEDDPYIVYLFQETDYQLFSWIHTVEMVEKAVVTLVFYLIILFLYYHSGAITEVLKSVWNNKKLVLSLSRNDFKNKYAGAQFGILWAFVQPTVTALIYVFVFQVMARSAPVGTNYPYSLWLLPGIIPWFYFSEGVTTASYSLQEYSYLVKKVLFNIDILPVVKIISSLFVHLFFVVFVLLVYLLFGAPFSWAMIQIPYYIMCTFCLVVAVSYFTCAILPFLKDVGQIISVLLNIGMWMSPIMWSLDLLPERYRFIMYLNPVFYLVKGYRESYMAGSYFFQNGLHTVYFWTFVAALFCYSAAVFRRLSRHFADVL